MTRGFRTVKVHFGLDGDPPLARELERARLVRDAIGPDLNLVCEVSERRSVGRATDIGRRPEEVGLFWLDDPTRGDDCAGLARIAAVAIPTTPMPCPW